MPHFIFGRDAAMPDVIVVFAGFSTLCAAGFIVVAILWLRKLRETVAAALAEAARQQLRTSQRLNDAVAQVQKQQRGYEQQLQILSQANAQLKQGLVTVASRLDVNRADALRGDQTVH
jgi:biopolymer transport protein ExbB/TolQ